MMTGKPISETTAKTSSIDRAKPLLGTLRPIFSIAARNCWRSSALWMTGSDAPIISTPYFANTPASATETAVFRPVWPPSVGSRASGLSFAMIFSTASGVIGST